MAEKSKIAIETTYPKGTVFVDAPQVIRKILPELRKENWIWHELSHNFGEISEFLDYLEEKYGIRSTKEN